MQCVPALCNGEESSHPLIFYSHSKSKPISMYSSALKRAHTEQTAKRPLDKLIYPSCVRYTVLSAPNGLFLMETVSRRSVSRRTCVDYGADVHLIRATFARLLWSLLSSSPSLSEPTANNQLPSPSHLRPVLQNGFFPQVVVFLRCSQEITVAIIEPAKQQFELRKQNNFVWLMATRVYGRTGETIMKAYYSQENCSNYYYCLRMVGMPLFADGQSAIKPLSHVNAIIGTRIQLKICNYIIRPFEESL